MLLGVISDTHGHVRNSLDAIQRLQTARVNLIVHCGDIGSPQIVELFSDWTTHFVLGNVDHDTRELQAAIAAAGHIFHDRFGTLDIEGKRIAFLHGDDSRRWHETVNHGNYDLVCYGHTHKAELRKLNTTLLLNPGAVFRANPRSVAVVDLPNLTVEFLNW